MKPRTPRSKILDAHLRRVGLTRSDLATILGVHYQAVAQWATGRVGITAERAVDIERATDGAIDRRDLRPDVFGDEAA